MRYQNHVYAYLFLIADPFPGFTGRPGSYPVEVSIAGPQPQNPWKVAFRLMLAIPAFLLESAYGGLLFAVALLGWFASLVTGSMPLGMRNAGALALRYGAQTNGYLLLLCEAYPYSGPTVPAVAEPAHSARPSPPPPGCSRRQSVAGRAEAGTPPAPGMWSAPIAPGAGLSACSTSAPRGGRRSSIVSRARP